jgi:hypothetical protein
MQSFSSLLNAIVTFDFREPVSASMSVQSVRTEDTFDSAGEATSTLGLSVDKPAPYCPGLPCRIAIQATFQTISSPKGFLFKVDIKVKMPMETRRCSPRCQTQSTIPSSLSALSKNDPTIHSHFRSDPMIHTLLATLKKRD